tara:strand:+ start:1921 stop:2511 length:591 start_codon:yes stop_codon:yes gene_type:complete
MAQDIRKLMKEHCPTEPRLSDGHEARFQEKLDKNFTEKKNESFFWLKIAAMVVVAFGVGFFGYQQLSKENTNAIVDNTNNVKEQKTEVAQITLGDISPDLKKVEDFYLTGINVQLSTLQINDENKEVIDGYMVRLNELDTEYTRLSAELNEVGPTEETITALIDNLKLRLDLLFKLKNKLKELKNLENEQYSSIQS